MPGQKRYPLRSVINERNHVTLRPLPGGDDAGEPYEDCDDWGGKGVVWRRVLVLMAVAMLILAATLWWFHR
jgi:hypothetical protein